jgi:hypothetical protein
VGGAVVEVVLAIAGLVLTAELGGRAAERRHDQPRGPTGLDVAH